MDRDEFINNGSSRAVFGYTNDLVVKIAIDKQGQRQNANEINAFRYYGSYAPLAKITAYGKNIVVMERVDALEYGEVEAIVNDEYYEDEDENGEVYEVYGDGEFNEKVKDVVYELERINGETDDNFQIGYNSNGNIVAYDYGYNSGGYGELVSRNLEGFLGRTSEREFLNFVAKGLNGSHRTTKRIVKEQAKQIKEMVRWR
jgi:hypothetical protein